MFVVEQVVVTQLLAEVAPLAEQVCTGTLLVLLVEQVVVVQLLPDVGPPAVQVCTGVEDECPDPRPEIE